MRLRYWKNLVGFYLLFTGTILAQNSEISLKKGLDIKQSCRIKPDNYALFADKDAVSIKSAKPVIRISGNNIVVDFQQSRLNGSNQNENPAAFNGLAILITGKNVTLKNARIQGYKVAVLAENASGLLIENSDFSYNYRPRLWSGREREDFSDWLSYHQNDQDEWLRYGAGMYLKNCDQFTVKNCIATGNQNALLMSGCSNGLVYNNTFQFNSGLGIGMYRSSQNRVMHNRLDWNVRGYSHGFYQRGQDSAGILVYEQCNQNLFAFNSATHSGDGFFLWAGQSTMDSGAGGCNDNWVFGNDFSHAPTNGIEITFSRNHIQGNFITDCTYGIWGGYSFESNIHGNLITGCKTGIAIEHGQNDTIRQNFLMDDSVGLHLWAREKQPADWAYAQKRDTRSRDAIIDRNVFMNVRKPLKISGSQNISINGENLFNQFEQLLEAALPNESLKFWRNDLYASPATIEAAWKHPELSNQRKLNFDHPGKQPDDPYAPLQTPIIDLKEPDSLKDGINAGLPYDGLRGREFIIMGQWGPYDFKRPVAVWAQKPTIAPTGKPLFKIFIYGPPGDWKVIRKKGVTNFSEEKGTCPGELICIKEDFATEVQIEFEFSGPVPVITEFGDTIPAFKPYQFDFKVFDKKLDWNIAWYNYDDASDPLKNKAGFEKLLLQTPTAQTTANSLNFAWWDSPAAGVQPDRFATVATAEIELEAGDYTIELSSDDGVRLLVDDKVLLERWDVHEPMTDEIKVNLGGKHRIQVQHFDAAGLGVLDFRLKK